MVKHRSLLLAIILSALLLTAPARVYAENPVDSADAPFMLPWPYGESYRITWGPYDHWASNPRLGYAVDFGVPEGTPLYAPADGVAHHLVDSRPSRYGLGNYIDLISGSWKIRLAHLLDARTGIESVSRGDFLGYSGTSGAEAAHLHIELYIWRDDTWTPAQPDDLTDFLGLPLNELVEGALATNLDTARQLQLAAAPVLLTAPVWKEALLITIPVSNTSIVETSVTGIQLSFTAEDGRIELAQYTGNWVLRPSQSQNLVLPFTPGSAGWWQLNQVTLFGSNALWRFQTALDWYIEPPALDVVGISVSDIVEIGTHTALELWVENQSEKALMFPALGIKGTQPDGSSWHTVTDTPVEIPAHSLVRLQLNTPVLLQTGNWRVDWLIEDDGANRWQLGKLERSFEVNGPQLVVTSVGKRSDRRFYLTLTNTGTRTARAEWADMVAVIPGSETIVSGRQNVIPVLEPGESTRLVFRLPAAKEGSGVQYVAGGYWLEGYYYPFKLSLDTLPGAAN